MVAMEDTIPVTASLQGTDLQVWLGRHIGDTLTWVVIEPDERREPRLVLSAESAITLVQRLGVQLAQVAPGS
ncbi:hypothetical protein KVF89_25215 [Nocardioides carbamazepini]|nr:hypothetical protein [Nocardioides carbamazepini]MCR1785860.1 hypothetical protein [Nocardioides carbamazepini]